MPDITLAVTGEFFRVYPGGIRAAVHEDFARMREALQRAYVIAGTLGRAALVDRITTHEPVQTHHVPVDSFLNLTPLVGRTETITGTHEVAFPGGYCAQLSRYHPVNGGCVPEHIRLSEHPEPFEV